jgi:hypothetical protein
VAVALGTLHSFYYFPRTVDDLFISLRYAEQWVSGNGLTYNRGEAVEGFSSPLWVALQALLLVCGLSGVTATKLLGLASLAGLLAGVFAFGRRLLGLSPTFAAFATVAVAANTYVVSWATLGLETPLFLALVVAVPVLLRTALDGDGHWTQHVALGVAALALATSRPEAPLYALTIFVATATGAISRAWIKRLGPGIGAAITAAGLLLWARWATYGSIFPHTYYAKPGNGFAATRLVGLVSDGAPPIEVLWLAGGLAGAIALVALRRHTVVLAIALTCALFMTLVESDWMPNQRHALPIHVMAALSWAFLLASAARIERRRPRLAASAVVVTFAIAVLAQSALVDSRFSPNDFGTHGRGRNWSRPKTLEAVTLAWRSLNGTAEFVGEPLDAPRMGMVQQVFDAYEASGKPQDATWYIGRDIGRVGWLSDIQVFDTVGLFTPEVVSDPQWIATGGGSPEVVARVLERDVVAAELLDGWAAAARPYVARSAFTTQSFRFRAIDTPSPTADLVLERYRRGADKLPFFVLGTLYGEPVGAAFQKRHRWIEDQLADSPERGASALPPWSASPVTLLDGAVVLHGCTFGTDRVPSGASLRLTCAFESVRPIRQNYLVFVHLVDGAGRVRAKLDHPMTLGFHPLPRWKPGELVIDSIKGTMPPMEPTELSARVGLWLGPSRAKPSAGPLTDPEDRVIGPSVSVAH